jgi:hypothetical protein
LRLAREIPDRIAPRARPRSARKSAPKAEAAQVHGHFGSAQSGAWPARRACRGAELEWNGVRGHAAVPHSLRKWPTGWPAARSPIDLARASHPSTRPAVSASAKNSVPRRLTAAENRRPTAFAAPARLFFSYSEKLAMARNRAQRSRPLPASSGSSPGCCSAGAQFGIAPKKRSETRPCRAGR